MSECQGFRVSECQSVRVSECQSVRVSECQSVLPSPDEKDGDTGCQDNQTEYSHYHRHKVKVGILGRGRLLEKKNRIY